VELNDLIPEVKMPLKRRLKRFFYKYYDIIKIFVVFFLSVMIVFCVAYIIKSGWNYIMPAWFNIKPITIKEAVIIYVLCNLLFGGFHFNRRSS
jgi:TRAP-type C4-dicarboxylate transport system permease small subunit